MSANREKKEAAVAELEEKLRRAQAAVITDYRGLNVAEVTQLRANLRQAGVEFKVVKNTLASRAGRKAGLEGLDQFLSGPTAIAFSTEDPVQAAKLLAAFARTHKALEIKGGVLEGRVISQAEVKALSELPGRTELLAQVLRGMQAPLAGLAAVLSAPMRNLLYGLEALRQREAQGNAGS